MVCVVSTQNGCTMKQKILMFFGALKFVYLMKTNGAIADVSKQNTYFINNHQSMLVDIQLLHICAESAQKKSYLGTQKTQSDVDCAGNWQRRYDYVRILGSVQFVGRS